MLWADMLLVNDCTSVTTEALAGAQAAAADAISCDHARRDLATAQALQRMLLPPTTTMVGGWTLTYRFLPAGPVSGDFVDIVPHGDRLYFMLGDVSGKGIVASMVMAQLHTMFRTMIPFGLTLEDLMTRASALLCASSLPAQYATLVCGYLTPDGEAVISNAGHPPPLIISADRHADVRATGVPIGMFCQSEFSTTRLQFADGDTLLAYTDGLTEATNETGGEYGSQPSRRLPAGWRRRTWTFWSMGSSRIRRDFAEMQQTPMT